MGIVTLTPERQYTYESVNDIAGILEPIIYMSRAYEESATKSKRIKEAWSTRRKEVREGKRQTIGKKEPFWIDTVEKKFVLNPDGLALVKRMFDLTIDGNGLATVARHLNESGNPTPRFKRKWSAPLVSKIVKGKAVLGEYQPCLWVDGEEVPEGEPIRNYYPPAISEETYYQAQNAIALRREGGRGRRAPNTRNVFQGLLFNARDGQPLY